MATDEESPARRRMVAALLHDEDLVEHSVEHIVATLPTYTSVSHRSLADSIRRNVRLSVRAISEAGVQPEALWEPERAMMERLDSGVPIEDMLAAFRVSIGLIQDRVVELAREHAVSDADVVAAQGALWRLSDAYQARGVSAYRQQAIAHAVRGLRRREEWVGSLLDGSLSASRLDSGAAAYRIPRDVRFCAVYLPGAADHFDEGMVRRALGDAADGALLVPRGHDVVGLVGELPRPSDPDLVICVGPHRSLETLAESYEAAQRVAAAVLVAPRGGVHTIATLGWRVAVPQASDVTDLLEERYLEPVWGMGSLGADVLKALQVYLDCRRSIPRAAGKLNVHVNTLRYRLARFEEVTGRSLTDTDTIVDLAWVLFARPVS